MSEEKEYNLYFSKIIFKKYYYHDKSWIDMCELHGDELQENELIEIKWNNGSIERYTIHLVLENAGFGKIQIPYILTNFNDTLTRICVGGLMARRIYEPKK